MSDQNDELATGAEALEALGRLVTDDSQNSGNSSSDDLQKANSSNEEDDKKKKEGDGDEYKPDYMRKNMKRYLKENAEEAQNYMKEAGLLSKAVMDQYDEGTVEDHDATVIDGTDMFKAFVAFTDNMVKAFTSVSERLEAIEDAVAFNNELNKASGSVLLGTAKIVDNIGAMPNPVRSQLAGAGAEGGGSPLQKAQSLGMRRVVDLLIKAAQNGNRDAATAVSYVEIAGGINERLPANVIPIIDSVIADAK